MTLALNLIGEKLVGKRYDGKNFSLFALKLLDKIPR